MALTIQTWARATVSANEPILSATVGCFREYNYYTADAQATVAASGYFNQNSSGTVTSYSGVYFDLVTGDYINVYSTTDLSLIKYRVTVSSGTITTALVGAGTVKGSLSLTAAQLIAGYAAPIAITGLAAPGAGYMYSNVFAQFAWTYGSAQFTTGGNLGIQYGSTANLAGTKATSVSTNTVINGIAANSVSALIAAAVVPTATASVANLGLYLSNDTAAFAVGTGTTVIVKVEAQLISLS